jgi:hypothetical protein
MSKLLLNLRLVPDDEADGVRDFLEAAGIEYYETAPSRWGISYGGIWVARDDDVVEARRLMAEFQARRRESARAAREQERREGREESFADIVRREPLRVALSLAAILFLLGLMALLPAYLLRT